MPATRTRKNTRTADAARRTRKDNHPAAQGVAEPVVRPLSSEEGRILRSVLDAPGRPNARLFFLENARLSQSGRIIPDIGRPHVVARLVEACLVEVIYHESYRYLDRMDAPGYIRLTPAGIYALRAGRYTTT